MHALTWIERHGKFKRSLSASDLRRATGNHTGRCTWCGQPVRGRRRHWCGAECLAAYQLRCQPTIARQHVLVRDCGICRICGFDVLRARRFSDLALADAREFYKLFGLCLGPPVRRGPRSARPSGLMRQCGCPACRLESGSAWELDHIKPVCRGGGLCDLDNYRLLCGPCHDTQTRELAQSRTRRKKTGGKTSRSSRPSPRKASRSRRR